MRERDLFKKNYPEIKMSEEAKQKLFDLPNVEKNGSKHNLRRAAVILFAICAVGLGGVGYAASNGYIFNSAGHKYKAEYYVNGEKKHVENEVKENGDFRMSYHDKDSAYESETQGDKDHTVKVIDIDCNGENGEKQSRTWTLEIDKTESVEDQIWGIRSQLTPEPQQAEKMSEDFLTKLQKTADSLGGVWQKGINMSLEDYRKINLGHLIIVEDREMDNGKKAWIYLDIEEPAKAVSSNKVVTVQSAAGEKAIFDVKLGNGGFEEISLHEG